ncbi:MAG TPA: protein kinase [Polyangiaceae bacterium]|nr:protein kinase [Polyangiaceae bacterium]
MSVSPSQARTSPSEIIGKMAGEYRLGRLLGEGGFGAVYEAEHPLLKRRAAVKVLHRVADRDSDAVQRFVSEAQAVNQIRNRHIIDVFSFGTLADGRHFYVMDYLEGEPLDRFLKRIGRLDVATALQLLQPIAEALDLAHGAGIIHRDLKPQNIFLAWDKNDEVIPKLLDFGMAKLLSNSPVRTVSGTPIGTPLYMSPEQARGGQVDSRCDVYALGVLCYEMLVGRVPFDGETTIAILMAHVIQAPERPSEVSDLPPEFDGPLLRMLEKDATRRPNSAGEAIAALREVAQLTGTLVPAGLPKLPRPDPNAPVPPSGELEGEVASTLLANSPTPERGTQVSLDHAANTTSRTRRRPWLAVAGVLMLGVGLTFWIRTTSTSKEASAVGSAQTPSTPPALIDTATATSAAAASSAATTTTAMSASPGPAQSASPAPDDPAAQAVPVERRVSTERAVPPKRAVQLEATLVPPVIPSPAAISSGKRVKALTSPAKNPTSAEPPVGNPATPRDLESPFGP